MNEPTPDRTVEPADVGVVLAGIAFAAAFLPWNAQVLRVGDVPVVAAAVGGVALAGFLARRHGYVDRFPGAAVAGVGSTAVVGYAAWTLASTGFTPAESGAGAFVALAGGVGGVVVARFDGSGGWADRTAGDAGDTTATADDRRDDPASSWDDTDDGWDDPDPRVGAPAVETADSDRPTTGGSDDLFGNEKPLVAVLVALGLGVLGFAIGIVTTVLLLQAVVIATGAEPSTVELILISTVGSGLGLLLTAVGFVRVTDRPEILDVAVPSRRDLLHIAGGVVAIFALLVGVGVLFQAVGVPSSQHSIVETARSGHPEVLLALVPLSFLLIGPGEELVFRNLVQKSLYGALGRYGAIGVASVVFALVHFSAYAGGDMLSTVGSLARVLLLSLLLGWIYVRTDNVVVPAMVHGAFNAVQFAVLYATLTGVIPATG